MTRDRASFGSSFLDDEISLLPRMLLQGHRGLLGGDERRAQQDLDLAIPDEVGLQLLDLVGEVGAFAPDVFEAGRDLLEESSASVLS